MRTPSPSFNPADRRPTMVTYWVDRSSQKAVERRTSRPEIEELLSNDVTALHSAIKQDRRLSQCNISCGTRCQYPLENDRRRRTRRRCGWPATSHERPIIVVTTRSYTYDWNKQCFVKAILADRLCVRRPRRLRCQCNCKSLSSQVASDALVLVVCGPSSLTI